MNQFVEFVDTPIYRYAFADWRSDRICVAMSDLGVVDVVIGDCDADVFREMCRRFPNVGFVPDRGMRAAWVRGVLLRLDRSPHGVCIPLDLGGRDSRRLSSCA